MGVRRRQNEGKANHLQSIPKSSSPYTVSDFRETSINKSVKTTAITNQKQPTNKREGENTARTGRYLGTKQNLRLQSLQHTCLKQYKNPRRGSGISLKTQQKQMDLFFTQNRYTPHSQTNVKHGF